MAWRRKTGLYLFLALLLVASGWLAASWMGLLDRATRRLFPTLERSGTLSTPAIAALFPRLPVAIAPMTPIAVPHFSRQRDGLT